MQILDTSVTNVILPHLQGSLSAGLDEVSWVITSYLAANAVVIPATGWLAGLFGRKRFFLICTTLFVVSSFLSGAAPDLTTLIVARIFQGLGGGPIIPLSQAILWEIFPFHQRGLAMAVWGVGFILGPILGPTVGGYLADEWSWRWIFYINLPVGVVGFLMASAFLFDPPYLRRAARIDWWGLGLMVAGFGCLQLVLDRGEREDWFDSSAIVALAIVAVCALVGFLIRELTAERSHPGPHRLHRPQLRHRRHADRDRRLRHVLGHAAGRRLHAEAARLRRVDLGPGAGARRPRQRLLAVRLGARDPRRPAADAGLRLPAQRRQPLHDDLAHARHGLLGPGLAALHPGVRGRASSSCRSPRSRWPPSGATSSSTPPPSTAWLRNLGGSIGIAVVTTLLAQRSQFHQATLVSHITAWDPETRARLARWASHFAARGSDTFTAERQAMAMLYRETVAQAQLLAYADDFWLLAVMFAAVPLLPAAHAPHPAWQPSPEPGPRRRRPGRGRRDLAVSTRSRILRLRAVCKVSL